MTKVSVQGVKSLWGDCSVFPRLGTRDTDRWRIILPLCATCQCPWCPILEKRCNHPKVKKKIYLRWHIFHRFHCFVICLDSWSFLQFDDFSWSGLRWQKNWNNWCFHLLSEINYMLFHDLFYRNYDFWISSSRSLQSKLGQRHKKVRKLTNKTLILYIPFILFIG